MRRHWVAVSVSVLLTAGFLVRLAALRYGFPLAVFGDEFVHVATAFKLMEEKTLRATFELSYVPPFFAYLLVPLYGVFGLAGLVTGFFEGLADFKQFAILNSEQFIIAGRAISALLGTGLLAALFFFVRRVWNVEIALAALFFAAFDFWLVHESGLAHFWVPMTFFIVTAFYAMYRLYESGERKWYYLSAILIALGYFIGYVPVILVFWFALAHFLSPKRDIRVFLKSGGVLAALLVLFSWLNPVSFMRQFGRALVVGLHFFGVDIPFPADIGSGINSLSENFGTLGGTLWNDNPLVLLAALGGFALISYTYKSRAFIPAIFVGFPVAYIIAVAFVFPNPDFRYVLPALPFIIASAAYFLFQLAKNIRLPFVGVFAARQIIFVLLIVFVGYYSLSTTFLYSVLLQRTDTRVLARNWIEDTVPSDERILVDARYMNLPQNKDAIQFTKDNISSQFTTKSRILLGLKEEAYPTPSYFTLNRNHFAETDISPDTLAFTYEIKSFYTLQNRSPVPDVNSYILVVSFPPRSGDFYDIDELLQNPKNPFRAVREVQNLGPYVEVYKSIR